MAMLSKILIPLRLDPEVLLQLLEARLHLKLTLPDGDPVVLIRCRFLFCHQFGSVFLGVPFIVTQAHFLISHSLI